MKESVAFVWDETCPETFEDIKEYFTNPPVLVAPISKKSFFLYVRAMAHSLGTLLA